MKMHGIAVATALLAGAWIGNARAQQPPAPAPAATPAPAPAAAPSAPAAGAEAYLISPVNGARIRGPVIVRFGLKGMGVTQAGSTARNAGHHHLLVDVTEPLNPAEPIPADKNHLHFGGGQTETKLDLPPGTHTLQLVLGDASHRLFSPSVESAKIRIAVLSPNAPPPAARHHRKRHRRHAA